MMATLPSLFIGHGSPMNTLERNPYTLDRTHPNANPSTNLGPRLSSAYITIMKVTAQTP